MSNWMGLLFESDYGTSVGNVETALFMLLMAFLIGQFIGWVYMGTHRGLSYSQTFVASLVIIPVIVALMMIIMAGSVMVAFGLLAVFAVVRFRNVLKDTRDTTFILWVIIEGLGVGTMRYSTSLIGALALAAVMVYIRTTSFGTRHRYDAVLGMQVSGDALALMKDVRHVLHCHCARTLLASRQSASAESLSLSYRVLLRDPDRGNELRGALESLSGVSEVSLFLRNDEAEI